MNLYKVYCDLCGEIQSVDDNLSKKLEKLNIDWGKNEAVANDYEEVNAEICSKCKKKIQEQLEKTRNEIIAKEKDSKQY